MLVILERLMSFHYSITYSYITQNQNVTSSELLTYIFVRISGYPQKNPHDLYLGYNHRTGNHWSIR